MISPLAILLCALLFVALGAMWIVGYGLMKKHSPENLPRFYLVLAVIRIVLVLTVTGIYILFISSSAAQSKSFALMVIAMYVAMMAITLKIKH